MEIPFKLEEGQHHFTYVYVMDKPGAGGAHHHYVIKYADKSKQEVLATILFQNGPVKEEGVNGIFIEDLLNICAHRLECFQAGPFACTENGEALDGVYQAIKWLNKRTASRQSRGVEGTNKV